MASETRTLTAFAHALSFDRIPRRVLDRAIDLLVDQIGLQIGCSHLPWAKQVYDVYKAPGGAAEATVVRYGDRLPLAATAFINATFGHSFEYDDANPMSHGHIGAELVPPLLATAEREHRSGRDYLTAFVAAYELRGRIGWAVSPDFFDRGGPQYSATCGPFGAAAGVSLLLNMTSEQLYHSVGIAGGFAGGLMQYDHGGGSVKRIYGALAAGSGVQSALMAQAGMTGPEEILEGKRGLLRVYTNTSRPERLVSDLGEIWTMDHVLFKNYPCCGVIHPAIDALTTLLKQHRLQPSDIASIEVGYPTQFHAHAAIKSPKDILGFQFSTSYSLALTVLKGRNTMSEYKMEAVHDPAMKEMADRVYIVKEPSFDAPFDDGHFPARIRLTTANGTVLENTVMDPKGSPHVPLSSADIDEKFISLTEEPLGKGKSAKLLDQLRSIEKIADLAVLSKLLF